MNNRTVQRINLVSFIIALVTIVLGVVIGILGVWAVIPREGEFLWKILASDAIVFAGAVLSNLAIACYRKPGGDAV
jgi:ABC-type spermidine/putrescine transport system permease subunit II